MKPIFNGKTWIVAVISIALLTGIGIFTEYELFSLLAKETSDNSLKVLETGGIAIIPYTVVKGIIHILDRLTHVSKNDN